MADVKETLKERGSRYGELHDHAVVTQAIKAAMEKDCNWDVLSDDKREALEMIAHKIGRILNGDPEYADSWHDIAGYAQLVEEALGAEVSGGTLDEGDKAAAVRRTCGKCVHFSKPYFEDPCRRCHNYRLYELKE
jgi:hypothetical protein